MSSGAAGGGLKQRIRPLRQKLDIATYERDKVVTFRFMNGQSPSELVGEPILIPLPLVYRLYHIGRAYDLPQLTALHPTGKVAVDYFAMQLLISELEQMAKLVNDPALNHYGSLLLTLLSTERGNTKAYLIAEP